VAITVLKHHVPWGPFTRTQIRDGLGRGDFTLQYLAHTPGLKEWLPLGEVLDFYDRHASLPPLPMPQTVAPAPHPLSSPETAKLPPVPDRDPAPASAPPSPYAPVHPLPTVPAARPPALPAQIPDAPLAEKKSAPAPMAPIILRPAPFIPRFFAFAIDIVVLLLPIVLLFGLGALTIALRDWLQHADSETVKQDWALLFRNFQDLLILVATGGAWLYAAGLECSRWQATVGKQWIGIKTVDRQGQRVGFFRATARHAAKYLSALPCFLGFTAAWFSSEGLSLHDRIAGTRVVRK
jgi:uncharacterized RDD family membrane protein YckC